MQAWSGETWKHADEGAELGRSTRHSHSNKITHNIKTTSQSQERLGRGGAFSSQSRSEMLLRRGRDPLRGPRNTKPSSRRAGRLSDRSLLLKSAARRSHYGPIDFSPSTLCLSILISNGQKINSFPTPGTCSG